MFKSLKLSLIPLRYQILSLLAALTLIFIVTYTGVVYVTQTAGYAKASMQQMEALNHAMERDYAELILLGSPSSSIEMQRKWQTFPMLLAVDLVDLKGNLVLYYSKQSKDYREADYDELLKRDPSDNQWLYTGNVHYDERKLGVVRYVVSNTRNTGLKKELFELLLITVPFALLLTVLLSFWLQKIFVGPLTHLMQAISSTTISGSYDARIQVHERDKSEFGSLSRSFNELLGRIEQGFNKVQESESRAQQLAYFDALTGLANRRLLLEHMDVALQIAKRENRKGALFFIDLDHFKKVNDSLGHAAGDELLMQVADRLTKVFRAEDTIARMGGDEFVILSGNLENSGETVIDHVHSFVLKLRHVLGESYQVLGESYRLSASIGVATFPDLASTPQELMKQADSAMYQAKAAGRDGYHFYNPDMQVAAEARLKLEKDLNEAIEKKELSLFYQPQMNAAGEIVGAEALIRWNKDGQFISPAEFIPIAEQVGVIVPIGYWVIKEGFRQLKRWQDEGVAYEFSLSINISPIQFNRDSFIDRVKQIQFETGACTKRVIFEVTESIIISDMSAVVEKMNKLTSMGIRISMDDFGTGYSSLMYLKQLPLHELKIDQTFVRDLHIDKADAEIAATIIAMAKNLNLDVVAEGVENKEQLAFLLEHGCTTFQGYYFYKPMPADEFRKLLF